MTKREFAAVGRAVSQGVENLRVCGNVLVLGEPRDVLVGFLFDQTRSKGWFKIDAVCIPLVVPQEFLGWVLGWALWNPVQRRYIWDSKNEAEITLLRTIVRDDAAKLSELNSPKGAARYGESEVGRAADVNLAFAIACCRARTGEYDSAMVALERVKSHCDISVPYQLTLLANAKQLEHAICAGSVDATLNQWREVSRRSIGQGLFS